MCDYWLFNALGSDFGELACPLGIVGWSGNDEAGGLFSVAEISEFWDAPSTLLVGWPVGLHKIVLCLLPTPVVAG